MTHTYAVLHVSPAAYEEIKGKLLRAGYGHAFDDRDGTIDMHGIGLLASPAAREDAGAREPTDAEVEAGFVEWSRLTKEFAGDLTPAREGYVRGIVRCVLRAALSGGASVEASREPTESGDPPNQET